MNADPWTEAMMRGDFEAAWRVCDRVLEERRGRDCSQAPRHLQHIWDGSALDGRRVLVRCYHGLGDTLQFARLLAPLRARAQHLTVWVQPALAPLMRNVAGVDAVLPLHDGAPGVDYDVDLELMEAAHALRLSLSELPGSMPYLCPGRQLPPRPRSLHDHALRVGLAWRSGPWDDARSLTHSALDRLASVRGVRWCSLQYPAESQPFEMNQLGCRDVERLAARMRTLDLIISVDTMTAHLAGALALPVWTLLPHKCDWRWMRERTDSPWYPTMRLFRQSRVAEWRDVVDSVAETLALLRETRSSLIRARDTRSAGYTGS
jgi:hypothetical protein